MTLENRHRINLAIMASGSGTNAENLILFARNQSDFEINVCCVISNIEDAGVLKKATKLGVETHIVPKIKNESRIEHEKRIIDILSRYEVDWICLAGYMRVLSPTFLDHFFDTKKNISRIINIHPSLLPDFPGLNAYEQAFDAKVEESGATVHFVDQGVDTGPVIMQMSFKRDPDDSLESFKAKGMKNEYKLYPQALIKIINKYNCNSSNKGQ